MNSTGTQSDALWHLVSEHTKVDSANSARIQICLLGSARILVSGRNVTSQIKYQKGIALLSLLAVECGIMHPRERIANFLWPDHSRLAALTNLRQVLSNLRLVLAQQERAGKSVIRSDNSHVGLFVEPELDLDIHTLTAHSEKPRAGEMLGPTVYEPPLHGFLEGFDLPDCLDYSAWLEKHRRQFDASIIRLHEKAIARAIARDNFERAVLHARLIERLDPSLESNQVCLMRLLLEMGRPKKALQQFELFSEHLREELDVEPEPSTRALHKHILERISAGEASVTRPQWHFHQVTNTTAMYVTCDDISGIRGPSSHAPGETIRNILAQYSHQVIDSHGLGQFAYFDDVHQGEERGAMAIRAARAVMTNLPFAAQIRVGIYSGQIPTADEGTTAAHRTELTELARRLGFVADGGEIILCADTLGELAMELEYLGEWRFRGINRIVHAYRLAPA